MLATAHRAPEQKRVSISSKRQFTIPQKFYSELGFEKDAICTMADGMLILQPAAHISGGEFAENILADLIAEGYSGQELLNEFKERQAKIRPAVEVLLEKARDAARGKGDYATFDEIYNLSESQQMRADLKIDN